MGLFDVFFKKQRQIESKVLEYLEVWEECLRLFQRAMDQFLDHGADKDFDFLVEQTHKRESHADDLRRKIEFRMYEEALLPESRGDILGFLEALDTIPNRLETILFIISLEKVTLVPEYVDDIGRLLKASYEGAEALLEIARGVFKKDRDLRAQVLIIDEKESACDRIERDLIRKIFASDLDGFRKISLRDLILKIGDITDMAENIADRITIMSYKRKV